MNAKNPMKMSGTKSALPPWLLEQATAIVTIAVAPRPSVSALRSFVFEIIHTSATSTRWNFAFGENRTAEGGQMSPGGSALNSVR